MIQAINPRAALSFGLGVVLVLAGAYLVIKAGTSTAGSPLGWTLVALGVVGVVASIGIIAGAYDD